MNLIRGRVFGVEGSGVGVLRSIISFFFLELVLSVKKVHLFHPQEMASELISVVILCTRVISIISSGTRNRFIFPQM